MKKILLLGYNSSIARAFIEKHKSEFVIHGFGRRQHTLEIDRVITGNWDTLGENISIDSDYDIIINLIFLRGESVEMNLLYTQEIAKLFFRQKKSCKLIHVSSTMVHGTEGKLISKRIPSLAENELLGYALVKARTEEYLVRHIGNLQILRFGYVSDTYDFLFIKFGEKICLYKGTKLRVVPLTYWNTVLKTICSSIYQQTIESTLIVVDENCNLDMLKKNQEFLILHLPSFILYLGLFLAYILGLKRLRYRLKQLNMQLTYEKYQVQGSCNR